MKRIFIIAAMASLTACVSEYHPPFKELLAFEEYTEYRVPQKGLVNDSIYAIYDGEDRVLASHSQIREAGEDIAFRCPSREWIMGFLNDPTEPQGCRVTVNP